MSSTRLLYERRRHPRVRLQQQAWLEMGRVRSACMVYDLSLGGALVATHLHARESEQVTLFVEPAPSWYLPLVAEVVHHRGVDNCRLLTALKFVQVPAHERELLERWVASKLIEDWGRPAVLVLDDCAATARAMVRDFRSTGYCAVAAGTIDEALRELQAQPGIHTAVVDLHLQSASGLDVLQHLSQARPDLRRVLASGDARARHLGRLWTKADAVLAKPWTSQDLVAAIEG